MSRLAWPPYGDLRLPSGGAGYNGHWQEHAAGYLLGNGYRAYWPSLRRFGSYDNWSPFGKGGINGYAYCRAQPINQADHDGRSGGPLGWLQLVSNVNKLYQDVRDALRPLNSVQHNITAPHFVEISTLSRNRRLATEALQEVAGRLDGTRGQPARSMLYTRASHLLRVQRQEHRRMHYLLTRGFSGTPDQWATFERLIVEQADTFERRLLPLGIAPETATAYLTTPSDVWGWPGIQDRNE